MSYNPNENPFKLGFGLMRLPKNPDGTIDIPQVSVTREFNIVTQDRGKPADCVQCGQCEAACPQHLPIISLLEECRSMAG